MLNVAGTQATEAIVAGQLGRRRVGVNLNSQADGAAQDADLVLETADPAQAEMRLNGRGGSDTLSALGGPGFTGPFPAERLGLFGGPGDDRLIGGPHDDRLLGGTENDTLLGGQGDDHLTVGPGSDLAKAGKGRDVIENRSDVGGIPEDTAPDKVYAGPGNDQIDVEQTLPGDLVRCASGCDRAIVDVGDRPKGCERVNVFRR